MSQVKTKISPKKNQTGRLRIGDDWNAITIIVLSQNNPLKAIAEFVENSIDAHARQVTIIRGREKGQHYLKITDDGDGIPCAEDGPPDFKYVATHICDSIKRRLKEQGMQNIQGEFGIGLLSFWTVGQRLTVISSGKDGKTYQMVMDKGNSGYTVTPRPHLLGRKGTELIITSLLEGNRILTGEKIQRYLSSELRDRIRHSGVNIKVIDRITRMETQVEPRRFEGQLIHKLPPITASLGDLYAELYLNERNTENSISLFRSGTRVLPIINVLDEFQGEPWDSGYFQGIIDAPFLNLTPGTRDGIIRDVAFSQFCLAVEPLKAFLAVLSEEQGKAEDERVSKNILRSVQKAFREAILALPMEEYDWFDVRGPSRVNTAPRPVNDDLSQESLIAEENQDVSDLIVPTKGGQKQFFEFAGPLFSARIQPSSTLIAVGQARTFSGLGLDKNRRRVDENLNFTWEIIEGAGSLDKETGEIVIFQAPVEPGITRLKAVASQGEIVCEAQATITMVAELIKIPKESMPEQSKGMPSYTLESAPGQLWRSRFDKKRNIVVINAGHRDFIYAAGQNVRKLRYICRLFAKELILHNFIGMPSDQLLERLIELSLYTEENLK